MRHAELATKHLARALDLLAELCERNDAARERMLLEARRAREVAVQHLALSRSHAIVRHLSEIERLVDASIEAEAASDNR